MYIHTYNNQLLHDTLILVEALGNRLNRVIIHR